MPADPRLMALPALRRAAEEEARDLYETMRTRTFSGLPPADSGEAGTQLGHLAAARLALLSDLTRPASAEVTKAAVVARLGGVASSGVLFERYGGEDGRAWKMTAANGACWWFAHAEHTWMSLYGATGYRVIPALISVTDPAEALTLIALAVLSASGGGEREGA